MTRETTVRQDIYTRVTNRIIEELEKGVLPRSWPLGHDLSL